MTRPVFLITLGAIAGSIVGIIGGGGGISRQIGDVIVASAAPIFHMAESGASGSRPGGFGSAGGGASHLVFSTCLARSGANVEATLRNLLEFHEHDATVALVGCLLESEPARFCGADGRKQAADAMEIYYWSRDDARRSSPAHGMADKIRLIDRAAETGEAPEGADPFAGTWNGPTDRAIFARLRTLAKQGYLDPGAFAFSGRPELREALRFVKPEAAPCEAAAAAK